MMGVEIFPIYRRHIMEEVVRILGERFEVEVGGDTLLSDLVQDSLLLVETLFEVEKEFGVRLTESDVLGLETVGDLARAVEAAQIKMGS